MNRPVPHRRNRSPLNLASALGFVVVAGMMAWLVLRQPALRQWLVGLVPHRYPVDMTIQRQWLAPRSMVLAALLQLAVLVCMTLNSQWRRLLTSPMERGDWLVTATAAMALLVAVATVADQEAFFLRRFGVVSVVVSRERVLGYLMPQAVDDAAGLTDAWSETTWTLTLEAGDDEMHNLYLVNALAYPLAFHDARTSPSGEVVRLIYRSRERLRPFEVIPRSDQ